MDDVERELGLSRERLVEMALLLGSDYTEVGGRGPGCGTRGTLNWDVVQSLRGQSTQRRRCGGRVGDTCRRLPWHHPVATDNWTYVLHAAAVVLLDRRPKRLPTLVVTGGASPAVWCASPCRAVRAWAS